METQGGEAALSQIQELKQQLQQSHAKLQKAEHAKKKLREHVVCDYTCIDDVRYALVSLLYAAPATCCFCCSLSCAATASVAAVSPAHLRHLFAFSCCSQVLLKEKAINSLALVEQQLALQQEHAQLQQQYSEASAAVAELQQQAQQAVEQQTSAEAAKQAAEQQCNAALKDKQRTEKQLTTAEKKLSAAVKVGAMHGMAADG